MVVVGVDVVIVDSSVMKYVVCGFILIEVMIVIIIMGVLVLICWCVLDSVVSSD